MRVPLRIAFIGTGRMAMNHLHAIEQLQQSSTVAGVLDRSADRAAEFAAAAGTTAYASIDDLFAEACPDVVHVCTPPAAHFEAARAVLERGAHVYVEKPFALSTRDARELVDLARSKGLLISAGHQLLHDPAFETLMARAGELGSIVQIDSHFAFRPAGALGERANARALAEQAIDVLPHPLYTLVAALERFQPADEPIALAWTYADPADLHAVLNAGPVVARLSISLRARPVASTLTLVGTGGSLTCDFVRSIVIGAGNPGTEALEKISNPVIEAGQLVTRTAASLCRRLRRGSYPGLAELIEAFYRAVSTGKPSPVTPEHLTRVTELFEALAGHIREAVERSQPIPRNVPRFDAGRPVVVTGARGFLGSAIARALAPIKGVSRTPDVGNPNVHEWIAADLSSGLPPGSFAGADVVVHAAAETAGGYDAHQRNSIDATRHLLHAMHADGVSKLVLVSSLSVIRPPRTPWETQDEQTPRPSDPRPLGAYTWGKSLQEALVEREAAALGIATRIIRPGALVDYANPELPGLMGRRLVGSWHLGLGRPDLPIAVCDVEQCAEAIAWCATHFDEAPPVVNLFDPALMTRGLLIERLRSQGWTGRFVWVPISVISAGIAAARFALAIADGRLPERCASWAILRPRRYDSRLARVMLDAARRAAPVPQFVTPQHVEMPLRQVASAQSAYGDTR
jgi:predicted dehydrogenase/nucleoside-diphosphate-sugar epimerase